MDAHDRQDDPAADPAAADDVTADAATGDGPTGGGPTADPAAGADVAERIREALRGVKDPELGFNIVDLGLVYDIEVEDGSARITMTLTSPGCPAGGEILTGARSAAESVDSVRTAEVNLVWKPFWTPDRIDPRVRAMMGY